MLLAFLSSSNSVFGGKPANSVTNEAISTARRALTELGGRPIVLQRGLQGELAHEDMCQEEWSC
jgi:hypothetical protein